MTYILPHIAVTNVSTKVSDADVTDWCTAVARQVTNHVRPSWDVNATVQFYAKGATLPTGAHVWPCVVSDHADVQGAGGYHTDESGVPNMKVFAGDLVQYGYEPSIAFSHEVLEALGDPRCQSAVQVANTTFWALELCDACEDDQYGYPIKLSNGHTVLVSDFVTPSWFVQGDPAPFDYMGHISKPLELLTGGYIGEWTPSKGWSQRVADSTAQHSKRTQARAERWGQSAVERVEGQLA